MTIQRKIVTKHVRTQKEIAQANHEREWQSAVEEWKDWVDAELASAIEEGLLDEILKDTADLLVNRLNQIGTSEYRLFRVHGAQKHQGKSVPEWYYNPARDSIAAQGSKYGLAGLVVRLSMNANPRWTRGRLVRVVSCGNQKADVRWAEDVTPYSNGRLAKMIDTFRVSYSVMDVEFSN
jgi:hypothetical protein